MEETELDLQQSASAVFNATGVATVTLTNNSLTRWEIKNTAVSTTSTARSICTTYLGVANPSNQVDYTRDGNGKSSDTVSTLRPSDFMVVQWINGTPGAVATAVITGNSYARGRRMY